jgi:hypothetical protein
MVNTVVVSKIFRPLFAENDDLVDASETLNAEELARRRTLWRSSRQLARHKRNVVVFLLGIPIVALVAFLLFRFEFASNGNKIPLRNAAIAAFGYFILGSALFDLLYTKLRREFRDSVILGAAA